MGAGKLSGIGKQNGDSLERRAIFGGVAELVDAR